MKLNALEPVFLVCKANIDINLAMVEAFEIKKEEATTYVLRAIMASGESYIVDRFRSEQEAVKYKEKIYAAFMRFGR